MSSAEFDKLSTGDRVEWQPDGVTYGAGTVAEIKTTKFGVLKQVVWDDGGCDSYFAGANQTRENLQRVKP
jgi:hypothetical protein